jgi:hypothetical protein
VAAGGNAGKSRERNVMTRVLPILFTGLVLTASTLQAGDSTPKSTVFQSDAGERWTVSIKPASRVEKESPRSLPVPRPVDVALVAAQDQEPTPPAVGLPPAPTIESRDSGIRQAYGVTVSPDPRSDIEQLGRRYAEAYRAVPFNRAEYDANPSYRHEAAMEFVFGQMRPTTIVKQMGPPQTDEPAYNPYRPYLPSTGDLYPWRTWPLRNPVFDPCFVAPNLYGGCYWP